MTAPPPPPAIPSSLSYHQRVRQHFKSTEPELWQWFADRQTPEALRENVRLELLKTALRLAPEDHPELYDLAEGVRASFGLEVSVTCYQAQSGQEMNTGLWLVPGELHVLFAGPVLERLQPDEMRAALAHEFAHYLFLTAENSEFLTTRSILNSLCGGSQAELAHVCTARNFDLYTEILCDRAALLVAGSAAPAIAALVKVATGLAEVNAEGYAKQAEEMFEKSGGLVSEGITHPEAFVRARALTLAEQSRGDLEPGVTIDVDAAVAEMIEGPQRLDELDLLGHVQVSDWTRRLIQALLSDEELREPAHEAQARLYFEDFRWTSRTRDWSQLVEELRTDDDKLRDYYCYVAIDFVAVDRSVWEGVLLVALRMFTELGWAKRLAELSQKELGLRKRDMDKVLKQVAEARKAKEEEPPAEPAEEPTAAEVPAAEPETDGPAGEEEA